MKINDLMEIVHAHYDDRGTENFFNVDKECPRYTQAGDTLAKFIVVEISETFEPAASTDDQLEEAIRVMQSARNQLNDLIEGLEEAANKAARGELL